MEKQPNIESPIVPCEYDGETLYLHRDNSAVIIYESPYVFLSHVGHKLNGQEYIINDAKLEAKLVNLGWDVLRFTKPSEAKLDLIVAAEMRRFDEEASELLDLGA